MNRAVCFLTLVSLVVAVSRATDDVLPPPPLPRLPRPSNNGSAAPQPPLMPPPPRRPNQTNGSADAGSHSHCDEDNHSGSGRHQPGGSSGNNGATHGGSVSGPVNIYVPPTAGRTGIIVGCATAAAVVATVVGVLLVRRAAAARNAATTAFSPDSNSSNNGSGFFATLKKKRMTIRAGSRKDRVTSVASADAVKCAGEPHDADDDLVSMSSVSVAADCAVAGTVVVAVDVAVAAAASAAAGTGPVLPIAMTPNAFAAAHSPFAVPAAADATTPTATLERRRSSSCSGHRLFAVLGHRVE